MRIRDGGFHVIDQVKSLREDKAIKLRLRYLIIYGQICYQSRFPVRNIDVEYVSPGYFSAVELRVPGIRDLQSSTGNVMPISSEEFLDVIAVDWFPTVKSPHLTQGRGAAKDAGHGRSYDTTKRLSEGHAFLEFSVRHPAANSSHCSATQATSTPSKKCESMGL